MADNQAYELSEAHASQTPASAMPTDRLQDVHAVDQRVHTRTLLKLDCLLLPFLALLFLFNALDKSNVRSATPSWTTTTTTTTHADMG